MTPRLHVFHDFARSKSFNPPRAICSLHIYCFQISSAVVDISLLNCLRAAHVFLNKPVNSEPIPERRAAWRCCLFIQGFAKKAKFLRENGLPAPCVSACLHKCLCAWLVVSWERTCVLWFGEYVLLNAGDVTVSWIVFQWIQQKSRHALLKCWHFSSLNLIPVMEKCLDRKTFHFEPSVHPSIHPSIHPSPAGSSQILPGHLEHVVHQLVHPLTACTTACKGRHPGPSLPGTQTSLYPQRKSNEEWQLFHNWRAFLCGWDLSSLPWSHRMTSSLANKRDYIIITLRTPSRPGTHLHILPADHKYERETSYLLVSSLVKMAVRYCLITSFWCCSSNHDEVIPLRRYSVRLGPHTDLTASCITLFTEFADEHMGAPLEHTWCLWRTCVGMFKLQQAQPEPPTQSGYLMTWWWNPTFNHFSSESVKLLFVRWEDDFWVSLSAFGWQPTWYKIPERLSCLISTIWLESTTSVSSSFPSHHNVCM